MGDRRGIGFQSRQPSAPLQCNVHHRRDRPTRILRIRLAGDLDESAIENQMQVDRVHLVCIIGIEGTVRHRSAMAEKQKFDGFWSAQDSIPGNPFRYLSGRDLPYLPEGRRAWDGRRE